MVSLNSHVFPLIHKRSKKRSSLILLLALVLSAALQGCQTSSSIVDSGAIKVGMSKIALRDALVSARPTQDPFFTGCYRSYDREKRIEVLASFDRSYYFIFRDVSNPSSGYCDRTTLGDGRLTKWVTSYSDMRQYLASSPTPSSIRRPSTLTSANVQEKSSNARTVSSLAQSSVRLRGTSVEQLQKQCLSFGFRVNTDGMANCILQLSTTNTNLAEQERQQEDQKRQRAARALYNLGMDIANPKRGNSTEPITRSVKNCVLSSDPFGRVYSFSGIACPSGYIPH